MNSRIIVVSHPGNDMFREYHLSIQITKCLIERLHPELIAEARDYYRQEIGENAWRIMNKLFAIGGVLDMFFFTHSIHVFKKDDGSWISLGPRVLEVLKKEFPQSQEVEIIELTNLEVLPEHYHPEDSNRPGFNMPA